MLTISGARAPKDRGGHRQCRTTGECILPSGVERQGGDIGCCASEEED